MAISICAQLSDVNSAKLKNSISWWPVAPGVCCWQALELAALATEANQFKDWWWKVQLAKCYYRLVKSVCVCMCVCACVYVDICMHVCVWIYACIHVYVCVCICVWMDVCVCVCVCMHSYMCVWRVLCKLSQESCWQGAYMHHIFWGYRIMLSVTLSPLK